MRVLLVEDDRLIGSGVEDGLAEAGMTVDWAHDGKQAQLALETTPYDLVVLDLGLPRMSGTELLDWIRKRRDHTPVLVMTARDTVADRVSGLSAGADDYLGKPFDPRSWSRAAARSCGARRDAVSTRSNTAICWSTPSA